MLATAHGLGWPVSNQLWATNPSKSWNILRESSFFCPNALQKFVLSLTNHPAFSYAPTPEYLAVFGHESDLVKQREEKKIKKPTPLRVQSGKNYHLARPASPRPLPPPPPTADPSSSSRSVRVGSSSSESGTSSGWS